MTIRRNYVLLLGEVAVEGPASGWVNFLSLQCRREEVDSGIYWVGTSCRMFGRFSSWYWEALEGWWLFCALRSWASQGPLFTYIGGIDACSLRSLLST